MMSQWNYTAVSLWLIVTWVDSAEILAGSSSSGHWHVRLQTCKYSTLSLNVIRAEKYILRE